MSWYYTYYLGFEKEGKLYPLGPYDCKGGLHSVMSISASFASDLYEQFLRVSEEMVSDELRKEFEFEDWSGKKTVDVWYLPCAELGSSDYIRSGYCLYSEVEEYLRAKANGEWFDYPTCQMLTPEMYAMKANHELIHGKPKRYKDEFDEWITPPSVKDYVYFAFPDKESVEYETSMLRSFLNVYEYTDALKDATPVILMTQG